MSDDLFDAIENMLAEGVAQVEDGRAVKVLHEGPEPPDDGNEWVCCYTWQGAAFWVLAQINDQPAVEGRFWYGPIIDETDDWDWMR